MHHKERNLTYLGKTSPLLLGLSSLDDESSLSPVCPIELKPSLLFIFHISRWEADVSPGEEFWTRATLHGCGVCAGLCLCNVLASVWALTTAARNSASHDRHCMHCLGTPTRPSRAVSASSKIRAAISPCCITATKVL